MSIGGWLLHFRIHSILPDKHGVRHLPFFIPFAVGIVNVIVTPVLLWFPRTLVVGYLLNGIGAVIGTVLMTYFSIVMFKLPFTVAGIFTGTLLGDILIAFSKLMIGQRILYAYHPSGMGRMFTTWWWTRHYVYISAAFILGHFVWR
jgi:hypothetical protein